MKLKTDNAIFQFISMTCDFIALNICFLICCIPVITIGPALSALFTVTLKEAKGEHGYLIRPFFAAWKENLKTVTVTWLIQLGAGAVLLFNVIFWYNSENSAGAAMAMIMALLLALDILAGMYVYPLHAKFTDGSKRTLTNAIGLLLSEKTATLALAGILIAAAGLYYVSSAARLFMTVIGFSFVSYCQAYILNKVFAEFE